MRRFQHPLRTGISALLLCGWIFWGQVLAQADAGASAPSLGISQLKVTSSNGQFIALYNLTNAAQDLSGFQLEYFNSYDVSKATSSKLIALSGTLPPHSYYIVNDSTITMCYRATVESVSLGLSSTAGLIELLGFNQAGAGGLPQVTVQDYVAWSKTAVSGAQTLPADSNAFLLRQSANANQEPAISAPGTGGWLSVQPDPGDPCDLVTANKQLVSPGPGQLLPSQEPAATIVSLAASPATQPSAVMPEADRGLMAPRLTELLPNPEGSGNDASDEYIELYNPNSVAFDLSGFKLQSGLTTTHSYIFPSGTSLPAKSFKAFYSSATKLSLSNSSGQAAIMDPLGDVIGQTDVYNSADDGQAWALANGKWYWTTAVTPGAANVIRQAASKAAAKSKTAGSTPKKAVKGAVTKKITSTADISPNAGSTPVSPWVLALVGVIALIYGAYEYRQDLANRIHELKRHLPSGRTNRPKTGGRRGD